MKAVFVIHVDVDGAGEASYELCKLLTAWLKVHGSGVEGAFALEGESFTAYTHDKLKPYLPSK